MVDAAGKEHLVLDLSCRKKEDAYYVVTDRWQKFTEEEVTLELMESWVPIAMNFSSMQWMWRVRQKV